MALPALTSSPLDVFAERLPAADVARALGAGAVLLDIRSQAARSGQGVLAGALAVDQFALAARCAPGSAESLRRAARADVWWVLVSAHGHSSWHATRRLRAAGLERVSDVVGGFAALRAARRVLLAAGAAHAKRDTATFAAHL